jgi:FixJ family two-component response regulator
MDDELRTVFIVEDWAEVRMALSRKLTAAGYRVRAFESAERFLSEGDVAPAVCCSTFLCLG